MVNPLALSLLLYFLCMNYMCVIHPDVMATVPPSISAVDSPGPGFMERRVLTFEPGYHDLSFPMEMTINVTGMLADNQLFSEGAWRPVPYPPPFLHAGLGYRIKNEIPITVTIDGALNKRDLSIIPINTGWNFFGNPYSEEVIWGDAMAYFSGELMSVQEAIDRNLLNETLKEYEGTSLKRSLPIKARLAPWKGYWTFAGKQGFLLFMKPGMSAQKEPVKLELDVSPRRLPADSKSVAVISVKALDEKGEPMPDTEIKLFAPYGRLVPAMIKPGGRSFFTTDILGRTLIAASCGKSISAVPVEIRLPEEHAPSAVMPSTELQSRPGFISSKGRFGINAFHDLQLGSIETQQSLNYMQWEAGYIKKANISFNRTIQARGGAFAWKVVEKKKGVYDFTVPDAFVRALQDLRLNQVVVLSTSNRLYLPAYMQKVVMQEDYMKPDNLDAFSKYVTALVERYDGDGAGDMPGLTWPVKYWEVGNEPEALYGFKGKDYLEVMKTAYKAVKSADKDAQVLVGAVNVGAFPVAGPREALVQRFWDDIMEGGGIQYFDILSMHHPIGPDLEYYEGLSRYWHEILKKNNRQCWMTEFGFFNGVAVMEDMLDPGSSRVFVGGNERETSAQYVKFVTKGFASGIDKFFLTFLYSSMPMEWLGKAALLRRDGSPRPVYFTEKLTAEKLDCFTDVKKLDTGFYEFTVGGGKVYVAWGKGSPSPALDGEVKITDIYGSESVCQAESVELTDEPVFIEPVR